MVNWLYTFFFGIMCLILIFRRNFLGYIIEFILIFLFLNLFLLFLIHHFTSDSVKIFCQVNFRR